ncbi:MAG: peroxiredoxin family protein [Ignavibacteria bacterium]
MKKTFLILSFVLFTTSFLKAQVFSDFTLPDVDGNDVTLSSLLEQGPVMVSFWASWCTPCKEEMRRMNDVYIKYKDKGFTYVAVNVDNQKSVAKVKSYVTSQNFLFPVLLDTEKKVFEAYNGKDELPYSLIIDGNKNIKFVHIGFKTGDEAKIAQEIESLLTK